ncbi:SMAD/FHA domain-containing protein [Exidia glandulosa HHB12029]|uniref:SMAD/FHA domain-containing protein n=1 Tax=Exidia glandulosa HHB12029 TaxID=1314781 RepID=A0A166AUW0_EXIGL|nr:SMAD/FHA domain-containing protein [Exidia glandulosa HHB12029]
MSSSSGTAITPSDPSPSSTRSSPLRLVVTASLILPATQRVAVLDGFAELSVGRDVSLDPSQARLRLKEMAVSKFHASLYFDRQLAQWAVVDLGSVHGTTVNGERLSGTRTASRPRVLKHGDVISIGSTVLVVHAHRDALPCGDCVLAQDTEIPLFDKRSREPPARTTTSSTGPPCARKAIQALRSALVAPSKSAPVPHSSDYKDRASLRRARSGGSSELLQAQPLPQTQLSTSGSSTAVVGFTFSRRTPRPSTSPTSSAPPLTHSNIGHQLLTRQGWTPGTALGLASTSSDSDSARRSLQPLATTLPVLTPRAGLGASSASSQDDGDGPMAAALAMRRRPVSLPRAIRADACPPALLTQRTPPADPHPERQPMQYISRHTTMTIQMPPGPSHPASNSS